MSNYGDNVEAPFVQEIIVEQSIGYCPNVIEELESLRFMGLNYRQLRDAIYYARRYGWKEKAEPVE